MLITSSDPLLIYLYKDVLKLENPLYNYLLLIKMGFLILKKFREWQDLQLKNTLNQIIKIWIIYACILQTMQSINKIQIISLIIFKIKKN